jgi:MFS family permease
MTDDIIRQTKTGRRVIRSVHRRRSIRAAIMTAILHTIGATCLLAGALQLYCLSQGADDLFLGLLNCAIWAGAPFLLLGMTLMRRFGKRRILVFWAGVMPAICMAFTPLVPLAAHMGWFSASWVLYWLLAAAFMRSASDSIGAAGWFPLLHDNVPSRITGKFFGTFRMYWQTSVLVSTLLIAWFLGRDPAWWKFSVVFAVGQVCFILKIFAMRQLREKPQTAPATYPSVWSVLKRAACHRETRMFLGYILAYNIASFMCMPFQIKFLKELGYSAGYIIAATSMISVGALLTLRFWGRLADRFGNRSVFGLSHIGMAIVLAGWLIVDRNAFSGVYVFALYGLWSVFQSANGIAQTRHMFHMVSESDQSNLVVINALLTLSIAVAPLTSGLFLWLTAGWQAQSGALNVNNYHMLFALAAAMVTIPHLMGKHFHDTKENSTSEVFVVVTRPLITLFGAFIALPKKRNNRK